MTERWNDLLTVVNHLVIIVENEHCGHSAPSPRNYIAIAKKKEISGIGLVALQIKIRLSNLESRNYVLNYVLEYSKESVIVTISSSANS
jgi:hypothetical protein